MSVTGVRDSNYYCSCMHLWKLPKIFMLHAPILCLLSRVVRKPTFCICENKDADQLRGNREADQRLCFRNIDSAIPLLSLIRNFKPLAIFCGCTAWFVSDLVGNPEDRFSQNEALFVSSDYIQTDKIPKNIHTFANLGNGGTIPSMLGKISM